MFQPKFTITPDINSRIAEIERLRALVDHAVILPELEVQLRFRATVEAVHNSTSIEGNPLNEQQVQKVLHGRTIIAADYAVKEVLNYKRALDWLNSREKTAAFFTSKDILHLHSLVMHGLLPKEKIGHWRPGNVYVIDEIDGKEIIRYTGPQAKDIPQLITSFLKWIVIQTESSLHPILLAGLLHYIFVSIHPFSDGNGRTTRLLTHHYLQTQHYDFRGTVALDSYYSQHQQEYYEALSRGNIFDDRMEADITPFLDFFTKGFLSVAQQVSQYVQVGKVLDEKRKPLRLTSEELIILDYVYQFGTITVEEAITVLNTSKRTVQRRLIELVNKNILLIEGQGPSTKYVLKSKLKG